MLFFHNLICTKLNFKLIVVVWRSIHSDSITKRTGAEYLSFYYPRLLYFPNQMLMVVIVLSHNWVLSSKTVSCSAPCCARCIGHASRTVCSGATYSQFGEGARLRLCMNKWNRPTSVRRQLSLTQVLFIYLTSNCNNLKDNIKKISIRLIT